MENMEIHGGGGGEEEAMDLPPGFRFHPTDEELITNYLFPKVLDDSFVARAIGEVDMNKCEPWELHSHAKMGENEWYFFSVRDRKYPTGLRTNRATEAGYWKATGKDKDIFRENSIVGMKKTLVFYKGRAPKGEKSNWVMHEYRLHGDSLHNLPFNAKNEWTICRIFHKNEGGKKVHFMDLLRSESTDTQHHPSENLPTLMDSSPYNGVIPHVPCFSNPMLTSQTSNYNNLNHQPFIHNPFHSDPSNSGGSYYLQSHPGNFPGNYPRTIIENHGTQSEHSMKTEAVNYSASQDTSLSNDMNAEISSVVSNYYMGSEPFDDRDRPSTSGGPVDLENLWRY